MVQSFTSVRLIGASVGRRLKSKSGKGGGGERSAPYAPVVCLSSLGLVTKSYGLHIGPILSTAFSSFPFFFFYGFVKRLRRNSRIRGKEEPTSNRKKLFPRIRELHRATSGRRSVGTV